MFLVSFTVALFLTVVLDGPPKRYQVKSLWSLLQDLVIFVMLIMLLVSVIRPVFERRQLLVYHDVALIVPLMLVLVLVMRELVLIIGHIIFQVFLVLCIRTLLVQRKPKDATRDTRSTVNCTWVRFGQHL